MKIAALFVSAWSLFLLLGIPGVATAGEREEDAEEARFYIAPFGGLTQPDKLQNVVGQSTRDLDSSGIYGMKVGFIPEKEYTWFGVEGEFFYTDSAVAADPVTGAANTNLSIKAFSTNFLLRYANGWIQPYIGVGPSVIWASSFQFSGGAADDEITTVGLNLLAGLRIPIANRVMLFGEYKHNRSTLNFNNVEVDYRLHALVAGFGVMF